MPSLCTVSGPGAKELDTAWSDKVASEQIPKSQRGLCLALKGQGQTPARSSERLLQETRTSQEENASCLNVPLSVTELQTGVFPTLGPPLRFSLSVYLRKLTAVNPSSAPVRQESSLSLSPLSQPSSSFLRDLGPAL